MTKLTLMMGAGLLALTACTPPTPAPIELRGPGYGQTSPGASGKSSTSSSSPDVGAAPPAGYAAPVGSGIQSAPLGEPNDAYSQATVARPDPSSITSGTMADEPATPVGLGGGATASLPPPAATQTIDQGSGEFGWPLRGTELSGYGPKSNGQQNDGLNIGAPLGATVFAAKDGAVAYAGNEMPSFGNMVLLRHPGGYFTVYAHLDQIKLTKGESVTRGQPVGTVGQSGGVDAPQLHFEIRKGSTPQDPEKYLKD